MNQIPVPSLHQHIISLSTLITQMYLFHRWLWSQVWKSQRASCDHLGPMRTNQTFLVKQISALRLHWHIKLILILFLPPHGHMGDLHFSVYKSFPCLQKSKPRCPHGGQNWSRTQKHFVCLFFIPPTKDSTVSKTYLD